MQKKKNIPAFLRNTYEMLQRQELSQIVSWADSGKGFVIKNLDTFSQQILPQYFKHKKYTSFVRQLNMYGFHKQRHANNSYHQFAHQHFRRGDLQSKAQDIKLLLAAIKRKPQKKKKIQNQKINENEQISIQQRSVSVILEQDNKQIKYQIKQNIQQQQEIKQYKKNPQEYSDCSQQIDQITQKVMEHNQLLRNIHIIIRNQTLQSKKRSIEKLTHTHLSQIQIQQNISINKLISLLKQSISSTNKIYYHQIDQN